MPSPNEIEEQFWTALKSDMTMMLGIGDADNGYPRPMTSQIEGRHGPLWFFTSTENGLAEILTKGGRDAIGTFTAKKHDVFATLHGRVQIDNDRAVIDRLWNRFVAAWFQGGKDDPKLVLLRFEPREAEIWLNEFSLVAGVKMLLGADPKEDYKDKVAKVALR